jgi:hypothetical protein
MMKQVAFRPLTIATLIASFTGVLSGSAIAATLGPAQSQPVQATGAPQPTNATIATAAMSVVAPGGNFTIATAPMSVIAPKISLGNVLNRPVLLHP